MMIHVLLIGAGVMIIGMPYLARAGAWRYVNRDVSQASAHTPRHTLPATPTLPAIECDYVSDTVERDWRLPAAPEPRPDYEGIAADDPDDGAEWMAQVRRAGVSIELAPEDDELTSRTTTLLLNREFERFDRIMTNSMRHVDTICAETIRRWIAEGPTDGTGELRRIQDWIDTERASCTGEFERIELATALLVS